MPRNHQAKGEYKAASSLSSSSKQRWHLYKGLGGKVGSCDDLKVPLPGQRSLGKLNHDLGPLLWEYANAAPPDSKLNILR